MIKMKYARNAFKEYLEQYDILNEGIILKIKHTNEVVKYSSMIAKTLGLSQTAITLAELIALLHDIGRFEQIKKCGSFDDSIFDHAKYGVYYLFDQNHIRDFTITSEYDQIIKKAIANHNLCEIQAGLNEKEKLYAKILRDADKLDIFRVKVSGSLALMYEDFNNIASQNISESIMACICEQETINRVKCKTTLDQWLMTIGFIFDINFTYSFEVIERYEYINTILYHFNYTNEKTIQNIEKIRKLANQYIKGRLNQ